MNRTGSGISILPVAGLLLLLAAFFDSSIFTRLSPDGYLQENTINMLPLLRIGLFVLAVGCVFIWMLRRRITRSLDWNTAVQWWATAPSHLKPGELVPSLPPKRGIILVALLAIWVAVANIGLHRRAEWLVSVTRENGVLETITVISYVFSGILALCLAFQLFGRSKRPGMCRWWLLALAAGFFWISGEETDWGQQYYHYTTPQVIEGANKQQAFNLHNLSFPGVGPNSMSWLLVAFIGALLPVMLMLSKSFRRLMWAWEVPLPPWIVQAVCYFLALVLPRDSDIKRAISGFPN